jgi:alpha-L-fucosidase
MYNANIRRNGGQLQAVYMCKDMGAGEFRAGSCLQDVERQGMHGINPLPWQTDTSVGDWFYNTNWKYTPAGDVIRFFVDIVSKNGNLLLNVVQRPAGDLDPEAEQFLDQMANWFAINGEAIYATRPWLTFGEGPALNARTQPHAVSFTARDVRYTRSKDGRVVYAIVLGWPEGPLMLSSTLVRSARPQQRISLLGSADPIRYSVNAAKQLVLEVPSLAASQRPGDHAYTFRLEGFDLDAQPEAKARASNLAVLLDSSNATVNTQQWNVGQVDGVPALVAWGDRVGSVEWLARFDTPGEYRLGASLQAPDGASSIHFEVDGQPVQIDLADSPANRKPVFVDAGTVRIASEGIHRITLRATNPATYRRVHVFNVYLSPQ